MNDLTGVTPNAYGARISSPTKPGFTSIEEVKAIRVLLLEDFVSEKGRNRASQLLGVTPPAISKAIAAQRFIQVFEQDDGSVKAVEISRFPSRTGSDFLGCAAL